MAPSSDLIWALVRNQSCYIKKQKNVPVFTSEPNNLAGLNSFKYSGLANKAVLALNAETTGDDDKKQVVTLVTSARGSKRNAPARMTKETGIKKNVKKGSAQLTKLMSQNLGRRDLTKDALKKYRCILKSFKAPRGQTGPNRKSEE